MGSYSTKARAVARLTVARVTPGTARSALSSDWTHVGHVRFATGSSTPTLAAVPFPTPVVNDGALIPGPSSLLIRSCRSALPQDLRRLEGHRGLRMVRDKARCVVASRARGGHAPGVLNPCEGSVDLLAARHRVAQRLLAVDRVGKQLHANCARVEAAQVDLDRELMPALTSVHTDRAEAPLVPVLVEVVAPRDELGADRCLVSGPPAIASRRRQIVPLGILAYHAVGREASSQAGHAFTHFRNPGRGKTARVARVKCRHDLAFQQPIERIRFRAVPGGVVSVLLPVPERPADFRRVRLRPPPIKLGQVETAVDEDLHAARPAGLPWPSRRVDPEIDALHEVLGQKQVI